MKAFEPLKNGGIRGEIMRRAAVKAIALALSVVFGGCGVVGPEACTMELSWRVTPAEAALAMGESITTKAEDYGCGGTDRLEEDMRWSSEDPTVAAVDEMTGQITAQAVGSTTIIGEDMGRYGIGPVQIPVTVEP